MNEAPAQREEIKEVPAAVQLNNEEVIPVKKDELAEALKSLRSQSQEYDENFTLTLDLSGDKEALMKAIVQKHKDSDFAALFSALRPLLFDLLKRREGFEDFTQTLKKLAKKEKIVCKKMIEKLEVKDILVLLMESCSDVSLPQLGLWFSYQFYPLPLISLLEQNEYRLNLDCCLQYLFQVTKPLITSIGTKSAEGLGKSSFLSYLFSIKNPAYFSTKNGFTHLGAVDLYINLPSDQQNFIVADVHSYKEEDQEFMSMISGIFLASRVVLVHITKEDIQEDGKVKLNFKVSNRSKILYLWRDYDDDEDEDLLEKVENSLESSELGIIGIPKLNGEQSFKVQNDKSDAMETIFEKINALNLQDYTPILDLFKIFKLSNRKSFIEANGVPKDTDFDREAGEIEDLLNQELKKVAGQSFTKSLLPCSFQDHIIIEERKKKKALSKQLLEEVAEEEVGKHEEKYSQIQNRIEEAEESKKKIVASNMIQKVMNMIASNELHRILLLSEVTNNWKKPHFEGLQKKYFEFISKKDGGNLSDDQKKALVVQMDDKDLSLSTFLDEVLSYYETNENAKNSSEYKGIKKYLLSCMLQGGPLNLVNGKTLKFGNELFKEIFENDIDGEKIFIISIIGAQSSAKSTLLNVLFGCGFSTSAGRCTKGIYISLLRHPSGFKIMVIDTEGLLSVMARDHEFDNLIATMTFSCSHVVIINNRGEINTKLRDLLEICVFAIKHLKLATIKPKIIFALRDIAENSTQIQQEMLLKMKENLEQAANKLSIDINQIIDFCQKDIFLLPSAFQLVQADNKTTVQTNNNLFASRVLEMRQYIFEYLVSISQQGHQNPNLLYIGTKQRWNDITELSSEIMRAKNFLEIELKDDALILVNTICQDYNEILLKNGQRLVDSHKAELDQSDVNGTAKFEQLLNDEFRSTTTNAMEELNTKIFKNKKYAILSNYFNEFREIVDYNLRWQKLRFQDDWKATILTWETDKEIKKFQGDIIKKVNEKLQTVSMENSISEVNKYFEELTERLQKEFKEKMVRLHNTITQNLPSEIYAHFDRAQQKANRDKASNRILLPPLSQIIDRIRGHSPQKVNPQVFYRYSIEKGKAGDTDVLLDEYESFVKSLNVILDGKPSDATAVNVINNFISCVKKMEGDGVSVNRPTFMNQCLLEAMYCQYSKAHEVEAKKIAQKKKEFDKIISVQRNNVEQLLDNSSDSYERGIKSARQWFRDMKSSFCAERGLTIRAAILKEVRNKFSAPETANILAYERAFPKENKDHEEYQKRFEYSLKYVLDINLYIKEIYEKEVNKLKDQEINRHIELQASTFISLIRSAIQATKEWRDGQIDMPKPWKLGSLIGYIDKNDGLRRYFPDLYAVELENIDTFTRGCTEELAKLIVKEEDVKKVLIESITGKIQEYLQEQYQSITGCQVKCPVCRNKCTKADPEHKDHQTNCHLLAGFGGVHTKGTDELLLRHCFDPKNYQNVWIRGPKRYNTYDEMIDQEFPEWRQEFPKKEKQEKLKAGEVPEELKKAWVGMMPVLVKFYGKKENTPKDWLSLVGENERLPAETFLIDYMTKKAVQDEEIPK